MLRKLISVLIMMSMLLSLVCVNVNASGYLAENTQLDVLKALEIVHEYSEEASAFSVMKKSTFINFLLNMKDGGKYTGVYNADALNEAQAMGIIDSANGVAESDTLKKDEAIKMAMCLLGYRDICLMSGGYPLGYTKKANQVGLTSGISLSDEVTNAEAYNLLFSTTRTGIADVVAFGADGNEYAEYEDMTVLNLYRDIYEVNGVVTANRTSGVYEEAGSGAGSIFIEEDRYLDPNDMLYDYLGYNVLAYAKKTSTDEYEIIYGEVHEDVEVIEFDTEDVKSITADCSSIEYYTDPATGKTAKHSIPSTVALLYNNAVRSDYTADDFKVPNGSVVLIDNDGVGGIDVIKLNAYKSMIVSAVSVSSNIITGEYTYEGSLTKLELEKYSSEGDNVRILSDGANAGITDIQSGDVLSVMESVGNAGKSIVINIVRNSVNADVTGYNATTKEVTAGDFIYEGSEEYYEANAKGESFAETISVGNRNKLYIDVRGKIVGARIESEDSVRVGYLKATAESPLPFGESLALRLFTAEGDWVNISLADKVRVNGESRAELKDVKARIIEAKGQLIGYGLDKENKISRIELPVAYSDELSPERLSMTGEQTYGYRWNNTSFDSHYYMDGNTKVIVVPVADPEDEMSYDIGNNYYFASDENVTFVGFGCDEYNFLDYVLVKRDATESKRVGNAGYFVREISEVAHPEGGTTKQITVSSATYLGLSIMATESSVLDGISKGDVVKIHVNASGYIDNVESIYKISDKDSDKNSPDYLHAYTTVKGTLLKTDPAGGRILLETVRKNSADVVTANKLALKVSSSLSVQIYDADRETVTAGSIKDLTLGDYVIANIEKSNVTGLFVIRYFD